MTDKHTGAEPPTCPYCGGAVEIAGHSHATCVEAAASRNANAANPPPGPVSDDGLSGCPVCMGVGRVRRGPEGDESLSPEEVDNPPPNTALHKIIACETCAFARAVLEAALKGKP